MQPIPVAAVLPRSLALPVAPPLMGAALAFAGQAAIPPSVILGQCEADGVTGGSRFDPRREARFDLPGLSAMKSLPSGACPGGEAVPAAGVDDRLPSGGGQGGANRRFRATTHER
jgi:hypothetical protein